ncbi:MAG: cupin domain-containing protein [Burkholderiaceae bacterium]|nr:MAG: cupin domain-containing protein [Burkholderiaceae bacterium]
MTSKLQLKRPLTLLGGLSAQEFLRDYWHKKPLLIRQAIPGFKPPVAQSELLALAQQEDVESRLIRQRRSKVAAHTWQVEHGPFTAADLPSHKQKHWTLLVQGVNLHHAGADQLLQQFNFIPYTRLDDVMISLAGDGGGVGPHFDSYDVFLLQAAGQRQWEISTQCDLALVEGMSLKILKNFQPEQSWVLEPGDMLYLPPHVAHNGVALGACMTWSIGFRAPDYQEIGQVFLEYLADTIALPGRYADPQREASAAPAWIDDDWMDRVDKALQGIRWNKSALRNFLGEYLSTPKPSTFFSPPAKPLSRARFAQQLQRGHLALDARTRMLYRNPEIFVNGESFTARGQDAILLKQLANERHLKGAGIKDLEVLIDTLHEWYCAGWVHLKTSSLP